MGHPRRKSTEGEQISLFSPTQLLPGRVQDGVVLEVSGTVDQVLYIDGRNARMEFMAMLDDGIRAKVVGRGDPLTHGDAFSAKGQWLPDPKHGRRFEADRVTTKFPETTIGIVKYLSSNVIKGVGKAAAEKLARHLGDNLPKAMQLPTELIAAGVSEDQAASIVSHWKLRTKDQSLQAILLSHGVGGATAEKIIRRYGDRAPSVVINQPYRLADEIKGIGFKKADAIAKSQNLPLDSDDRIRAGLKAVAKAAGRDGDTCQPRSKIILETAKLLLLSERDIRIQEERLIKSGELIIDRISGREVIYDTATHLCEEWVAADIFSRIAPTPLGDAIDNLIEACADHVHRGQPHFKGLHEGQHAAVKTALLNQVSIITGGPGTGKTATLRTLIACLQAINPHVRIRATAPTGAAGQRITESTGFPAATIHTELGATGEGFRYGKSEKLECDVFFVDESSMIDIWLMRSVLEALPANTRIILIGDANQLPSVGQGNVFNDLIECGVIPVARLTKVYRQGKGSEIAIAAEAIKEGRLPKILKPARSNDNWTSLVDDPNVAVTKLLNLATQVLPDLEFDNINDFQVITPGHQNTTGTIELNKLLQAALNPAQIGKVEFKHNGRLFRTGDKVVQTENDADRQVFNGNIGRIVAISVSPKPLMIVQYRDREVYYEKSEIDALAQAWAITVHRSQGSEARVVAPILTSQHYIQLKRNLYYTALTRARELCCTIGQYSALKRAVQTEGSRRLTGLAQRIAAKAFAAKSGGSAIAF